MDAYNLLLEKIQTKQGSIGIIGLGYVGSALAEMVIAAKYKTIGFVRTQKKADEFSRNNWQNFSATTDSSLLKECDVILVCVQTPIYEDKTPDVRALENAIEQIASVLRPGQLIVVESSIAPGMTRKIVLPILEKTKVKPGKEYFLAHSPERVDPGNIHFKLHQIPKVVGGLDDYAKNLAVAFYGSILDKVVPVSSVETAEFVKIMENTFRLVNISLVNELMEYANELGLNMWEVIGAAATKPFGFMPHYPGPGVGGHCIPVDPYYLLDDAKKRGMQLHLIEEAGKINDEQPKRVVQRALEILNEKNGTKKNHKIMLIGVSYKPDIDDIRESPALKIWEDFQEQGISVSYHDPYVKDLNGVHSQNLSTPFIDDSDMFIITTNHNNIDYNRIVSFEKPILDTRNVYKNQVHPNVFRI